jgi:hypothetical protein
MEMNETMRNSSLEKSIALSCKKKMGQKYFNYRGIDQQSEYCSIV